MGFDSLLNIVWALVGVAALIALNVSERRRYGSSLRSRWRRGVAVVIATAALFPCISASDDLVCLEQLQIGYASHTRVAIPQPERSNQRPRLDWALQLASLENSRIATAASVHSTLYIYDRVTPQRVQSFERPLPARAERGPPRITSVL